MNEADSTLTMVQDKLDICENCKGKKTTYMKGEWQCKKCDADARADSSAEFILRGSDWPSKGLRKHKPARRKY
jgi:hypothetical protein